MTAYIYKVNETMLSLSFIQVKLNVHEVRSGFPPQLLNYKKLSYTEPQKQWGTRPVVAPPARLCVTTVVSAVGVALTTIIDQRIIQALRKSAEG